MTNKITGLTPCGLPGSAALGLQAPLFLVKLGFTEGLYGPPAIVPNAGVQTTFLPLPEPVPASVGLPFYTGTYSQLKAFTVNSSVQATGWATDLNQLMFYTGNKAIGDQGWESFGV